MAIYILNLTLIWLYALTYNILLHGNFNKRMIKGIFVFIATFQLILLLSLRHISIGVDVSYYISFFKNIASGFNFDPRFELGYRYLNQFIGFFTNNQQIFLTIISIICIAPVGRFIYKHSKMPFLSFTIYIAFNYYSFTFSGLRQAISYAIIFISYDYIKDRKFIKFLICVISAGLFHKSSLIFIPAYFLYGIKINKITISSLIIFDLLIFIFRKTIFSLVTSSFYQLYNIVESASYTWMIFCVLIVFLGSFVYENMIKDSADNSGLYMLLLIGVSLMIFASVGDNVMRIANYYYMFVIIFIPEALIALKDKKWLLVVAYLIIVGLIVIYLWFLKGSPFGIVPYKLFW